MRLHTDYQLRNIGTFYFLVPLKSDHPVIDQTLTLNETGAFLWNSLPKDSAKTTYRTAKESNCRQCSPAGQ